MSLWKLHGALLQPTVIDYPHVNRDAGLLT